MEKLTNVVSLDVLQEDDSSMSWEDYIDQFKDNVYKGAIFARRNDGTYVFVCTEDNKIGQERLLYHVKDVIDIYVRQYPDFIAMQETAELMGKTVDEVLDENFEIELLEMEEGDED